LQVRRGNRRSGFRRENLVEPGSAQRLLNLFDLQVARKIHGGVSTNDATRPRKILCVYANVSGALRRAHFDETKRWNFTRQKMAVELYAEV